VVQGHRFLELAHASGIWADTGLELDRGERATVLAHAVLRAAATLPACGFQVLMQIGQAGPVLAGGGRTHSVIASRPGALRFAVRLEEDGGTPPPGVSMVAIRWRTPALQGLRALANGGDVAGLVRTEIGRLCNPRAVSAQRAVRGMREN
jgi:hypothetical protein